MFLTVVTFATAETLAGAFLSEGRNVVIATFCVIVIVSARRFAAGIRESELSMAISSHEATLAELKRARHLVDIAQRSSGHFVAMMSHEIRTPLHGLMATIDMLCDEPLSPEGSHRIGISRLSARTLLNIANDILDPSRIDAGGFPLELRVAMEGARPRSFIVIRRASSRSSPTSFPTVSSSRQTVCHIRTVRPGGIQGLPACERRWASAISRRPCDAMAARKVHTLLGIAGMVGARQVKRVAAGFAGGGRAPLRD